MRRAKLANVQVARRRLGLGAALAIAAGLLGCGSGGGLLRNEPVPAAPRPVVTEDTVPAGPQIVPPLLGGLPPLPQDGYVDPAEIAARRGSTEELLIQHGDEFFSRAPAAVVDDTGHSLLLDAEPAGSCWAIYRFADLVPTDDTLGYTVSLATPYPAEIYLGLADYARQLWRWYQVDAPGGDNTVAVPYLIDAINDGGSSYLAVVACGTEQARVQSVTLDRAMIAPPPQNLEASDGEFGAGIKLSWEDPALSYPGKVYDEIVVERALQVGGPWAEIARVQEGILSYDDTHAPGSNELPYNQPLYYRLRTYFGTTLGLPGLSDAGFRVLDRVEGLSATDGAYCDRVKISWQGVPDADAYILQCRQGVAGDWQVLAMIAEGTLTTFEHCWDSPSQLPCACSCLYEYRCRAALYGDTSLEWSNLDQGYREIGTVTGLAATAGTFHDKIVVSWNAIGGADSYFLEYRNESGGQPDAWAPLTQAGGEQTEFEHTFSEPVGRECYHATTYSYRIKAAFLADTSADWSEPAGGYRQLGNVSALLASDDACQDKVAVSWDGVDGADAYELAYLNLDGGAPADWTNLALISGGATAFEHTCSSPPGKECVANTSYAYRVRACFVADRSVDWSSSDAGRRFLNAPDGLLASDEWYPDKIVLSWSKSGGATGYEIYRDLQDTPLDTVGDTDGYVDSSLADYLEHTYWLKAVDPAGASPFSQAAVGERIQWVVHAVDSGAVGTYTALATINGYPAISYHDYGNGALKYARATTSTPTGGADWQVHTVDAGEPDSVGTHTSLTALASGYPAIAYRDDTSFDLMYAAADSATPSSDADWTVHAVDQSDYSGLYTSMLLLDGKPAISFYNGALQFARASTAAPSSAAEWSVHTVDSGTDLGWHTSLGLVNGLPAISYFDYWPERNLKYARAATTTPGSSSDWSVHTVDTLGDCGRYASLAQLDNKPLISYYDADNGDLRFAGATTTAPAGSDDWQLHPVDRAGTTGSFTSLAVLNGLPVVGYRDVSGSCLKLARAVSDPTGENCWVSHIIDASADVGEYVSLMVSGNQILVSYYNADNGSLKFARTE